MRFVLIAFLSALFTGCNQYVVQNSSLSSSLLLTSSGLCSYNVDSKGRVVSWNRGWPLKFYFEESVPYTYKQAIIKAAESWMTEDMRPLIVFSSMHVRSSETQSDGRNTIYWEKSPGFFKAGEQAKTVTRWRTGQIFDADVVINARDFAYFTDESTGPKELHLQSLLVHEFGHALGIKHLAFFSSVMFPNLDYLQIRTILSEEDNLNLRCQYP